MISGALRMQSLDQLSENGGGLRSTDSSRPKACDEKRISRVLSKCKHDDQLYKVRGCGGIKGVGEYQAAHQAAHLKKLSTGRNSLACSPKVIMMTNFLVPAILRESAEIRHPITARTRNTPLLWNGRRV